MSTLVRIKPEPHNPECTPQVGQSVDYFVYLFRTEYPGFCRAAFVGTARVKLDGSHHLRLDRPMLRRVVTAMNRLTGTRGDL